MAALLRGWAFSAEGPLSHVSLVNDKGQFLKLQAFALQRDDIDQLFRQHVGRAPEAPLGFHIETPVLDESPITVQFWREKQLVHQMPIAELVEGYWGTLQETESGVALTLGIGRQQLPEPVEIVLPLRLAIRSHLIHHYYWYLFGIGLAVILAALAVRLGASREPVIDPWVAGSGIIFLLFFLLGRAAFYGLVEAAVVPGVERYMDCAAPLASIFLLLLAVSPLLLSYQILLNKKRAVDNDSV